MTDYHFCTDPEGKLLHVTNNRNYQFEKAKPIGDDIPDEVLTKLAVLRIAGAGIQYTGELIEVPGIGKVRMWADKTLGYVVGERML